jgi:hypothetical protein
MLISTEIIFKLLSKYHHFKLHDFFRFATTSEICPFLDFIKEDKIIVLVSECGLIAETQKIRK